MNKDEFNLCMQQPAKLNSQTLNGLIELVNEFPYCSSVRILLSMNQYKEKDVRYETELRTTAIYSGSRNVLKKHIDRVGLSSVRIVLPDEGKQDEVSSSKPASKEVVMPHEEIVDKSASPQTKAQVHPDTSDVHEEKRPESLQDIGLSIQELKDIVNRHIDELQDESLPHIASVETVSTPVEESKETKEKSKEEILEEFLKKQPSISRPKATFYNPVEVAKESIIDQENIISETLATIYFDQGHLQKAIKIYQKLSLKYPEKSSYFAALINKAEKELNT